MKSRNMLLRLNRLVPPRPPEDRFSRWFKEHREYAFYEEIVEFGEILQDSWDSLRSLPKGDPFRIQLVDRLAELMEKIEDRRKRGKRPKILWQRPRDRWGRKPPSEDDPSLFYADDEIEEGEPS
jgi:hypothetical protein